MVLRYMLFHKNNNWAAGLCSSFLPKTRINSNKRSVLMSQSVKLIGVLILAVILWFCAASSGIDRSGMAYFRGLYRGDFCHHYQCDLDFGGLFDSPRRWWCLLKPCLRPKPMRAFQGFVILIVVAFLISNVVD